jgi:hypothetical protein
LVTDPEALPLPLAAEGAAADGALEALPAAVVAAGAADEVDELLQAVAATAIPTSSAPAAWRELLCGLLIRMLLLSLFPPGRGPGTRGQAKKWVTWQDRVPPL